MKTPSGRKVMINSAHYVRPAKSKGSAPTQLGLFFQFANPWIQVTFDTPVHITGVITQGHPDDDYWVIQYKVKYSNDDGGTWQYAKDTEENDKVS